MSDVGHAESVTVGGIGQTFCGGRWDRSRVTASAGGISQVSAGAGRIGQECLQEQLGLFKSMCRKAQDWSGVYVKVGGIGQVCQREWARLVKSIYEWK